MPFQGPKIKQLNRRRQSFPSLAPWDWKFWGDRDKNLFLSLPLKTKQYVVTGKHSSQIQK